MAKSLFFIFLIFFNFQALAFIPPNDFILKKVIENNGKGAYLVEQTVNLRFPTGTVSLDETVGIDSENLITIYTRSKPDSLIKVDFVIKYQNYKRDNGSSVRSLSKEFFEPILFSRNADLLSKKIETLFQLPLVDVPNRFSRHEGVVAFAFGKPTPSDSKIDLPGFWVEQDTFLIRKIRFGSEAYLEQSDFVSSAKGLLIAKNKFIKWDSSEATIQIHKVHEKNKSALLNKNLQIPTQTKFKIEGLDSSEIAKSIKDFYERFR